MIYKRLISDVGDWGRPFDTKTDSPEEVFGQVMAKGNINLPESTDTGDIRKGREGVIK